jgi:hypothetical protein
MSNLNNNTRRIDAGTVSLLSKLFAEREVLFTIELGTKVEQFETSRMYHLRCYEKE